MSFRHLSPGQNRETANLLLSLSKAIGIAIALALLVGGPQFDAVEWLAGLTLAVLFAILGIRMIGTVEKVEQQGKLKPRRTARRK